jgi:hypothetical protein
MTVLRAPGIETTETDGGYILSAMRGVLLSVPAAVALVAGFVVAGPVERAEAKPEYARKEGKACSFCHVNARGGGDRNAKGMEYERNGLKFPGAPTGYGEDDAFSSAANGTSFYYVREAIDLGHYSDALRRLKAVQGREKPKGPAAQKILNAYAQLDGRGRDLLKVARDAVANGQLKEAAEALARVENDFRGREPAKEVAKVRAEVLKLPGGKEADAAAKAIQPQRLLWLDALMKQVEGETEAAKRLLSDLLAKHPQGPFAAQAKAKIEELSLPPAEGG